MDISFCVSCLNTTDLFNINEPFKEGSHETFSNIMLKCFNIETNSEEALYLCLKCTYNVIDAYIFKKNVLMTMELLEEHILEKREQLRVNDEVSCDEDFSPDLDEIADIKVNDSNDFAEVNLPKKTVGERYRRSYVKELNLGKEETICPICNKNLFWPIALRCHIRQEHSRRVKCDVCDRTFAWKSSLNRHKLTHDPGLKDMAVNKQKLYNRRKPYYKPKQKYTEPTPYKLSPNQTVCDICHAEFTQPRMLRIHMHDHFPLHVCEHCGKGYATKNSLRKHKTSHESGPHTCQHCGKVFDLINTLQSHIRCRHGSFSLLYPCGLCEERFSTSLKRVNHRAAVHGEDIKVYPCPHCPRVFKVYVHRSTHIKSRHVAESKKTCALCSKQFSEVKNLGRHMRKVHKMSFSNKKHSQDVYLTQKSICVMR